MKHTLNYVSCSSINTQSYAKTRLIWFVWFQRKSWGPNMASKADMTPEEREAKEQEEFQTGPLKVLTDSVKNNTQVLINCRWNLEPYSCHEALMMHSGTTRSCLAGWRLSTATATWCWRGWRRCGLSCPRLARVSSPDTFQGDLEPQTIDWRGSTAEIISWYKGHQGD